MKGYACEYPTDWLDYELIDSGDGAKLERFGTYTLNRPDPKIIWPKTNPSFWNSADALFDDHGDKNVWKFKNKPPDPWIISYKNLKFSLACGSFKHIGIFPEQAAHWNFMAQHIRPTMKVLNLFAYTGAATITLAASGAHVTHVDSMKSSVSWAHKNAGLSGLDSVPIRWIVDDVLKFTNRELRRGEKYDAVIMDPPKFGRGNKGEVWKFEHDFPKLLRITSQLLSDRPAFVIVNAYTVELSATALFNAVSEIFGKFGGTITHGELCLKESNSDRLLPTGIFCRFSRY